MIKKFTLYALPVMLALLSESAFSEMFVLSSGIGATTVLSIGAVQKISAFESAVGFHMISIQHVSNEAEPRLIARNLLVALCNVELGRLGTGQILTRSWSNASMEAKGVDERVLQNENYSPPQFVDKKFRLAYQAADLACSKVIFN